MNALRGNNGPRYRHLADDTAPYETITVDKLTPIIGAEVGGVDLAGPSNQQMDEIHRALAENLVIFFRDQHMAPEQHLDFGRRFGPLHIHPAAPHAPGLPELMIIHADKDSPRANGEGWHSDVSCDTEPPMGSILYIKTCPPRGGDTLFASMYAAYDGLSDGLKTTLATLRALHSADHVYGPQGFYAHTDIAETLKGQNLKTGAVHPVVISHPVSGRKALFVNPAFTISFEGWTREESLPLLQYLYAQAMREEITCRLKWKPGSLAIWDNRITWHFAKNDYHGERRLMHRITVAGEPLH